MNDLTTRATEIVKQSRQCGRICIDAEDHCPCRGIARAVVAMVMDEARGEIIKHSDVARKNMSECYEQGNPEDLDVWSSIVAHLDIAQEKIRALGVQS